MNFELSANGTLTSINEIEIGEAIQELDNLTAQMNSINAGKWTKELTFYSLFKSTKETIEEYASVLNSAKVEEVLMSFYFNENAGASVKVAILNMIFTGQYKCENFVGALLWSRDELFAAALLNRVSTSVESEAMLVKMGLGDTPLLAAVLEAANYPMSADGAVIYIDSILFGEMNISEALTAALNA